MSIDFGDLRRTEPISRHFGFDRGTPIDRYYIEQFLESHAGDIKGRTLEIGDDTYTRRFGGDRTSQRDVLHVHADNQAATIVGDLTNADHVPDDAFDCIVLTQTLHLILDMPAALRTVRRCLKPGGVLLATFPAMSPVSVDEWSRTWSWSLTERLLRKVVDSVFEDRYTSVAYGNLVTATGFCHGLAIEDLPLSQLDARDVDCEIVHCVRAKKPTRSE